MDKPTIDELLWQVLENQRSLLANARSIPFYQRDARIAETDALLERRE